MDLLKNSVKTNCYYFATNNEADLRKLKRCLSIDLKNEFEQKAAEWTFTLVNLVKPEIILCEGLRAFRKLNSIEGLNLRNCREYKSWATSNSDTLKVISTKRNQSSIIDKDKFSVRFGNLIEN